MTRLRFVTKLPRIRWCVLLLTLGLGGCAHPEVTGRIPTEDAPPFSDSGDVPVPDRWWTAFGSPALDEQIRFALDGSYTLDAAWERVCAASALTRREASDLLPDLDGIAEGGGTLFTDGPDDTAFAVGVDLSYELDLWGRIGYRVDAAALRTSATLSEYHTAALTLSAAIARTWFTLVEAQAQLMLLDEQIATNLTGLELQEARFALGQIRGADVLRQRQLVEATREQAIVAQSRVDLLEHQLAVLQGRAPQQAHYTPGTALPELPPLPDTGLPADLVTRRPDVIRDYLALQAADRDLASAISAQYPRINLLGSVTTVAESPENLFRDWLASIAGQIVAPLFDGGERRAEVDRTAAIVRQRIAEYGDTVLLAFQEVEDALALERYQLKRIDLLNSQLNLARQASIQLREQYLIGETDYLNVLSAITQEQRLQRDELSARLELVLFRISLYLALAGDFESRSGNWVGNPTPEPVNDE
jgi:NodT family efflux transporter outer membrane factor (OMF) lipoprotein